MRGRRGGSDFTTWANRWMGLASYTGPAFPAHERLIERVLELRREPLPDGWQRELRRDQRLLTEKRFTRELGSEPVKELVIEATVLAKDVPPTEFLGSPIIDGVNAV